MSVGLTSSVEGLKKKKQTEVSWRKNILPQDSINFCLSFLTCWFDVQISDSPAPIIARGDIFNPYLFFHPPIHREKGRDVSLQNPDWSKGLAGTAKHCHHAEYADPLDIRIKKSRDCLKVRLKRQDMTCHHTGRDQSRHSSLPPGHCGQVGMMISAQS